MVLALCACLLLTVVVLRKPLADWLWPDTRIQQLLQRGDAALARGQLSAANGSGARPPHLHWTATVAKPGPGWRAPALLR